MLSYNLKNKNLRIFATGIFLLLIFRILLLHLIDSIFITEHARTQFDRNCLSHLNFLDYFSLASFLILIFYLLATQVKRNLIGELFEKYHLNSSFFIILAVAISSIYATAFFQSGKIDTDILQQTTAAQILANEFKTTGQFPFWTFLTGCGTPFLQFYPIFGIALTAAASLITGDPDTAMKAVLFILNILSCIPMFFLIRKLFGNNIAALAGALAYSLNYFLFFLILNNGTSLAMTICLMPLFFLLVERTIERGSLVNVILLSLASGLLWLTHSGHALFLSFFAALWTLARLNSGQKYLDIRFMRNKFLVATAFILSILISAFHIVPNFFEKKFTLLSQITEHESDFFKQSVNFFDLLYYSPFHKNHYLSSYIGLSTFLLALAGLYAIFKKRESFRLSLFLPLVCIIAFFLGFSFQIFKGFNPFYAMKTPYRFIVYFVFFQSLLAAAGIRYILDHYKAKPNPGRRHRIAAFIIIILVVDLLPFSFQSRFKKGEIENQKNFSAMLSRIDNRTRTIDVVEGHSFILPRFSVQTPAFLFYEELPKDHRPAFELLARMQESIRAGAIDQSNGKQLADTLNIFNVKYIIAERPLPAGYFKLLYSDSLNKLYELADPKPFPVIGRDGSRDFTRNLVTVRDLKILGPTMDIALDIKSQASIEFPFSHYPYLDIIDNGKRLIPESLSDLGFPVIRLDQGGHQITIKAYKSKLRQICASVSIWAFGIMLAMLIILLLNNLKRRLSHLLLLN